MALLRSPDGAETLDVSEADVQHYLSLGATYAPPPEEPGLEAPPFYADPTEIPGFLLAGPASRIAPLGRAAGGALRGAGSVLGRITGLPGLPARAATQAAPAAAQAASGTVASRIPGALARLGGRQLPGVSQLEHLLDFGRSVLGKGVPAAAEETGQALTGTARLRAMKPLRANASREATTQHLVDLEQAMAEAKLPEPAKKRLLEQMGHAQRKPFRPGKAEAPRPGTAQSRMRVVEGGGKATSEAPTRFSVKNPKTGKYEIVEGAPPKGTAASRVKTTEPTGAKGGPQHEVRYYSESQGKDIDISTLNQKHLEAAYRKIAATNPKPESLNGRVLKALLDEAKHRHMTTGVHVGHLAK